MPALSSASRVQANLQELFEGNITSGHAYIKFQLTPEITALLSMQQVQKSSIVKAEQITPLPSMPQSTIGMIGSGDRVFCVFDLAELLSLTSKLLAPQYYQILVLQTEDENPIYVGFAVTNLQGIIRIPQENIQPPEAIPNSTIKPYISGAISEQQSLLPILDFDRILQALNAGS